MLRLPLRPGFHFVRPLLPRLLLCAILLLNGIGSAVASTHVALAAWAGGVPVTATHRTGPASDTPAADCPHTAGQTTAADAPAAAAHAAHAAEGAAGTGDAECLKLCLEICLQQCQAMLATGLAGPPPVPRTVLPVDRAAAPAADAAYPPLRPPIA